MGTYVRLVRALTVAPSWGRQLGNLIEHVRLRLARRCRNVPALFVELACISILVVRIGLSRVRVRFRMRMRLVVAPDFVWFGCSILVSGAFALFGLRLVNVRTGRKLNFCPNAGAVYLPLERVAINAVLTLTTIRLLIVGRLLFGRRLVMVCIYVCVVVTLVIVVLELSVRLLTTCDIAVLEVIRLNRRGWVCSTITLVGYAFLVVSTIVKLVTVPLGRRTVRVWANFVSLVRRVLIRFRIWVALASNRALVDDIELRA